MTSPIVQWVKNFTLREIVKAHWPMLLHEGMRP
jgi:hypothetical protein